MNQHITINIFTKKSDKMLNTTEKQLISDFVLKHNTLELATWPDLIENNITELIEMILEGRGIETKAPVKYAEPEEKL